MGIFVDLNADATNARVLCHSFSCIVLSFQITCAKRHHNFHCSHLLALLYHIYGKCQVSICTKDLPKKLLKLVILPKFRRWQSSARGQKMSPTRGHGWGLWGCYSPSPIRNLPSGTLGSLDTISTGSWAIAFLGRAIRTRNNLLQNALAFWS